MGAAVAAGNTKELSLLSHSLKSSAFSVGAMQLGALCQRLEHTGKYDDINVCRALAESLSNIFLQTATEISRNLHETV